MLEKKSNFLQKERVLLSYLTVQLKSSPKRGFRGIKKEAHKTRKGRERKREVKKRKRKRKTKNQERSNK
jgi:hypothetical protein